MAAVALGARHPREGNMCSGMPSELFTGAKVFSTCGEAIHPATASLKNDCRLLFVDFVFGLLCLKQSLFSQMVGKSKQSAFFKVSIISLFK